MCNENIGFFYLISFFKIRFFVCFKYFNRYGDFLRGKYKSQNFLNVLVYEVILIKIMFKEQDVIKFGLKNVDEKERIWVFEFVFDLYIGVVICYCVRILVF